MIRTARAYTSRVPEGAHGFVFRLTSVLCVRSVTASSPRRLPHRPGPDPVDPRAPRRAPAQGVAIPRAAATLLALAPVALACGGEADPRPLPSPTPTPSAGPSPTPTPTPTARPDAVLFPDDRVLELAIELDPADWDALRAETRTLGDTLVRADCLAEPFASPYTYRPARVTLDGWTAEWVGLRKKGFLGSLSTERPSLKVKLDEYVGGQTRFGVSVLDFNNVQQDPAIVRTCLAYHVHAKAGVPAPRCAYAHVTVNGRSLGLYAHVEPVRRPFLERAFGGADGELLEGTVSDFRPGWTGTFEVDRGDPTVARARVDAVVAALEADDARLLDALGAVVDLDRFYTYWAVESLLAHWDGYPGNANNFYVSAPAADPRLRFIPWGPDGAMTTASAATLPASILASSALTRRLARQPEGRARYEAALDRVLTAAFDEVELTDAITRASTLFRPFLRDAEVRARVEAGLADARSFVRGRRAAIARERRDAPPRFGDALRETICLTPIGEVTATFDTRYGTHPSASPLTEGRGTISATISGQRYATRLTGAQLGAGQSPDEAGQLVLLVAGQLAPNDYALVYVVMPPMSLAPGTYPFDGSALRGALARIPPGATEPQLVGFFFQGELIVEEGGIGPEVPARGRLRAPVIRL